MKKMIYSQTEEIFAMSKILDKYAIQDIAEDIGKFIYFSECNSSHGPRIKFYGGSKETSSTQNAPTMTFDSNGNCEVELADWMNKHNCPNAFNKTYLQHIENFIQNNKCILLLVWFQHLDEGDALAYFHGQINLDELIQSIDIDIPSSVNTLSSLDTYCKEYNLYKFNC